MITTRPRLRDRVRRRIPESWRLWADSLLGSNVGLRRLVLAALENRREAALVDAELAASTGPWLEFRTAAATVGCSERVVEIPWVISRYLGERRVLDVGTAFAVSTYVRRLTALGIQDLHGVDIAPVRFHGVEMVQADVRNLPYPDGRFDLILCVSTLEHIGRGPDRFVVRHGHKHSDAPDVDALREFGRVLTAGGRLLVTVPFGQLELHPWMKQYDRESWIEAIATAGLREVTADIYGYSADVGWKQVLDPAEVTDNTYAGMGTHGATAVMCAVLSR